MHNFLIKQLKCYAITDIRYINNNNYTIDKAVEEAILGGASIIQIREKQMAFNDFVDEAKIVKNITKQYNIPLIINDNIEVALECDADGVHLGQNDLKKYNNDFYKIRSEFEGKILGISANTLEEAKIADKNGADYLGIDTPFSTKTKLDYKNASFEEMRNITNNIKIPCVAIGGINKNTIPMLANTGIVGVAMISAIFDNKNVQQATDELSSIINSTKFY